MRTAIVNIAQVLTGSLDDPLRQGDTIVMDDGVIESVGRPRPMPWRAAMSSSTRAEPLPRRG